MTPANSTCFPVYNQPYNLSVVVRSSTSLNPITAGLTGIVSEVSLNDGAFAPTATAALEAPATSGVVSIDLSAAEMSADKVVVQITVTNSGAIFPLVQISPLRMTEPTGRADAQTQLLFEQYLIQALSVLTNAFSVSVSGNAMTVFKTDSIATMIAGTYSATNTSSMRGKLQ